MAEPRFRYENPLALDGSAEWGGDGNIQSAPRGCLRGAARQRDSAVCSSRGSGPIGQRRPISVAGDRKLLFPGLYPSVPTAASMAAVMPREPRFRNLVDELDDAVRTPSNAAPLNRLSIRGGGKTISEVALVDTGSIGLNARTSPVTPVALSLAIVMALVAFAVAFANDLAFASMPNPAPLIIVGLGTDLAAGLACGSRIAQATRVSVYAVLYLSLASIAGVLAAYAGQRFQMPLRDALFAWADRAMGVDWGAFTHWVDCHAVVAGILHASYETMTAQIIAPAVVLAFTGEDRRLRIYLLAFSIGLAITAVVSALLPALSPIAAVDRATYHVLNFPGATPLASGQAAGDRACSDRRRPGRHR